jgi:hypothetical protein
MFAASSSGSLIQEYHQAAISQQTASAIAQYIVPNATDQLTCALTGSWRECYSVVQSIVHREQTIVLGGNVPWWMRANG